MVSKAFRDGFGLEMLHLTRIHSTDDELLEIYMLSLCKSWGEPPASSDAYQIDPDRSPHQPFENFEQFLADISLLHRCSWGCSLCNLAVGVSLCSEQVSKLN